MVIQTNSYFPKGGHPATLKTRANVEDRSRKK